MSDELWARIQPLLPVVVPRRGDRPGRPRLDDCKALCHILFVLHTAIPWEFLPQELGFGSGMTCRRRHDWNEAGVWRRLHENLPAELNAASRLDWSRAVIDGSHLRAMKGGPKPVDRARTGSKHHVITEAHGIPPQVSLTGGNRNDVTELDAPDPGDPSGARSPWTPTTATGRRLRRPGL